MKGMRFSSLPGDFCNKSKIAYYSSPRLSSDSPIESSDQHQDHQNQHDRIEDEQHHGGWAHEGHDDICCASACKALESFGVGLRSDFEVFERWCIGVEVPACGI